MKRPLLVLISLLVGILTLFLTLIAIVAPVSATLIAGMNDASQQPSPALRVNYAHDVVEVIYTPGHTVWLTVTNNGAVVKASAVKQTTANYLNTGNDGFQTFAEDWYPRLPNIVPTDVINVRVDDGTMTNVQVGEITGTLDPATDTITGTINAPWLPQATAVSGECQGWGAPSPPPNVPFAINPDGADPYTCSWDPGAEWDVKPGQDLAVIYDDSGHKIINVFRQPAPHLFVDKWTNAPAVAGNNLIVHIAYENKGDAPADNVVLTDTLGAGMSYITDTTPLGPSFQSGNTITWNLGTLPPDSREEFKVYVSVGAAVGQPITNTVELTTTTPANTSQPSEYQYTWSDTITDTNDARLSVYKSARTDDPAPGSFYTYEVDVCNDGSTDSGAVTLTDTLPMSTTLSSWWSPYPGWQEVSNDFSTLVLSKPSVAAFFCDPIFLDVYLESFVMTDTQLVNTAEIAAATDLSTGDDVSDYTHFVGEPRTNLKVAKSWLGGTLAPGGFIRYGLDYHNDGNQGVGAIRLTDTLPAGTSFIEALRFDFFGPAPFTPTIVTADSIAWDIETLNNGEDGRIEITLGIDSDTPPGAVLTNTAALTPIPQEDTYGDNSSAWVEQVYSSGPNLRIFKDGFWDPFFPRTVHYNLWVENVGTEPITNVVVTDTYPIGADVVTFDTEWWRLANWIDYPDQDYFTATFTSLNPGESTWIDFDAHIPPPQPLPGVFTNTAEVIAIPGEANLADNVNQSVIIPDAPDTFIEKRVDPCCGLSVGNVLTYTLALGNLGSVTATNVVVTDVLPSELSFVSASLPPSQTSPELVWMVNDLQPGHIEEIVVNAQVSTAPPLPLVNWAAISNDNGDLTPGNNTTGHSFWGTADLVLTKTANVDVVTTGGSLIYGIEVSNNGPDSADNVVITDILPEGLSNVSITPSECTRTGRRVTCNVGALPVGESVAIFISANAPNVDGAVTNTAWATANQLDPAHADNMKTATTLVTETDGPVIIAVLPNSGQNDGATTITIFGGNFQDGAQVFLGDQELNANFLTSATLEATVPAGLPLGTYAVRVVNPDGKSARLLEAFTVYSDTLPTVSSVSPAQGPNDRPVVIDIEGSNFAPLATVTLAPSAVAQQTQLADVPLPVQWVDVGLLRAIVPADTAPGLYDLTVMNPNGSSDTLTDAYQAVDASLLDDLLASNGDFFLRPAGPVTGQSAVIGLRVSRIGGQAALNNVEVAFYNGDPGNGGTLIGSGIISELPPNSRRVITDTVTAPAPGNYTLYAVVDPDNNVPENDENNNTATRDIVVRPLQPDIVPPTVDSFSINNGDATTSRRQVTLDTLASDDRGVARIIYVEYILDANTIGWLPVKSSGWIPYDDANSDYAWNLHPEPGVHFLQVFVADKSGNISEQAGEAFVNLIPASDTSITHGQVHVYRAFLEAGDTVDVRLTSVSGNADLYVWDADSNLVATSQDDAFVDEVNFTAAVSGIYQIEVDGFEDAVYQLNVAVTSGALRQSLQGIDGHIGGRGQPYSTPSDDPSDDASLPSAPITEYSLYLPIMARN